MCPNRKALNDGARHPGQLGSDVGCQALNREGIATTTQDLSLWKVEVLGPGAEVAVSPLEARSWELGIHKSPTEGDNSGVSPSSPRHFHPHSKEHVSQERAEALVLKIYIWEGL